jgi:hypothetical protein
MKKVSKDQMELDLSPRFQRVELDAEDIRVYSRELYFSSRACVRDEIKRAKGQPIASINKQIQTAIMAHCMKLFTNLGFAPDKESFTALTDDVLGTWRQHERGESNMLFEEIWGEVA